MGDNDHSTPAAKVDMGTLTTHVLDTAQGKPGAGIRIDLYALQADTRRLARSDLTNRDGRCDEPMLAGDAFRFGMWELVFHIGVYFTQEGLALSQPPFLDLVPVRFSLAADEHYHVPLLVSPWSYTTYRGS